MLLVLAFLQLIGHDWWHINLLLTPLSQTIISLFFIRILFSKIDFIPLIASFFFNICRGRQLKRLIVSQLAWPVN